jgi:hypothetical protein
MANDLGTLSLDAMGKLDVLGHDGAMLGMDSAQVGVFKESNQVCLRSLQESHEGRGLEREVCLEVLGDFTDKVLEGQLTDEELSGLLVVTDLRESNSIRAVTGGFLDISWDLLRQ